MFKMLRQRECGRVYIVALSDSEGSFPPNPRTRDSRVMLALTWSSLRTIDLKGLQKDLLNNVLHTLGMLGKLLSSYMIGQLRYCMLLVTLAGGQRRVASQSVEPCLHRHVSIIDHSLATSDMSATINGAQKQVQGSSRCSGGEQNN